MATECLLIAAFSARQIARSAVAAGYDVLAVDFFNDRDLAPLCQASARLEGDYPDGFSAAALLAVLHRLADGHRPIGLVYGAGFEDRPELLDEIARHWPILGNDAAAVRAIKHPLRFAQACRAAGVAHPETRMEPPTTSLQGWLAKRIGGAGGGHVVPAATLGDPAGFYFQRQVAGERLSLGFVAQGTGLASLGVTRQWCDPVATAPFRYGGAVGPLDTPVEARLVHAVRAVLRQCPLVGLCSADFVVAGDADILLEINPRPGATLDVHDTAGDPLVAHHLAALRRQPMPAPHRPGMRASGLAWARQGGQVDPTFAWPAWAADLPPGGAMVAAGEPLCTITVHEHEHSGGEAAARRLFAERDTRIPDCLRRTAA